VIDDDLLADAAERARSYLRDSHARPVFPRPADVDRLAAFDEPLPAGPQDPAATLRLLDDVGSPATVASAGGRYFGFVTGGSLPVAVAAHWLGTAWDQNAALGVMSPVAARLGQVAGSWLVDLLGLPAGTGTTFVTGATMANAAALAAARDRVLAAAGWDAAADGLFGAPEVSVVTGERAHSTLRKALGLVGLGRDRVHLVPVDDQGRLRAEALPDVTGPIVVCAQAGEVNSGAFDPFGPVVDWARERGAWVHVDGAFGLWAAVSPGRRHLVSGMDGADSWATDGHKWLNVPYDSGMVFLRDPTALRRSLGVAASYLPTGDAPEPMHHSPESSQRARAIDVWAALRTLGRSGVADLVDRCCDHAARIADHLRGEPGVELLNDVVLNQVLVRVGDAERTAAFLAAIEADGTCWIGPTVWAGMPAVRISVSSWATTDDDVTATLAAVRRALAG